MHGTKGPYESAMVGSAAQRRRSETQEDIFLFRCVSLFAAGQEHFFWNEMTNVWMTMKTIVGRWIPDDVWKRKEMKHHQQRNRS